MWWVSPLSVSSRSGSVLSTPGIFAASAKPELPAAAWEHWARFGHCEPMVKNFNRGFHLPDRNAWQETVHRDPARRDRAQAGGSRTGETGGGTGSLGAGVAGADAHVSIRLGQHG